MVLNTLYAQVARARRRAYRRPDRRRRLGRPVVSVGNLSVGGSGKTPTVACLARLLLEMGERPAILSRGYGRRDAPPGAVVVSDGRTVLADLDRSGDEPLMLARSLEGVAVVVADQRYLAGLIAEHHLGATVHVLDDGFQHFQLERDIDLIVVTDEDVSHPETLPGGRLRESLSTAAEADAVLVPGVDAAEARELGLRLGVDRAFGLRRVHGEPRRLDVLSASAAADPAPDAPVLALAGIGHPESFFSELTRAGWRVVETMAFRDHHRYRAADIARIVSRAKAAGASAVVTTEKDLMRLLPFRPLAMPLLWVPLRVTIEPAAELRAWLAERLQRARAATSRAADPDRSMETRS
jgi:tetraacyldisaccharide 4'-kinase